MITSFRGEYNFLSNFYESPLRYEGLVYPTVENFFQAMKTLDLNERKKFTNLTPKQAKSLGRRIKLRDDWEEVKVKYMYFIIHNKFRVYKDLQKRLIETGNKTLIEGNTWGDRYWGVCNNKGYNMLGQILMKVREEAINGKL